MASVKRHLNPSIVVQRFSIVFYLRNCPKSYFYQYPFPPAQVHATRQGNILCRIQTMSENPSLPKNPRSKIQTAPFKAAAGRSTTKPIQNPNGPFGFWGIFIWGVCDRRVGAEAMTCSKRLRMAALQSNFFLGAWLADYKARNPKVPGSIPSMRRPNPAPISRGSVFEDFAGNRARLPAARHGNWGSISRANDDGQGGVAQPCPYEFNSWISKQKNLVLRPQLLMFSGSAAAGG